MAGLISILQMATKHLSLAKHYGRHCFKSQTEIKLENVISKLPEKTQEQFFMKIIIFALLIFTLTSCSTRTILSDKIIYYKIDTSFYKAHPDKQPLVNALIQDSIYLDLRKTGKELTINDKEILTDILSNSTNHADIDCGTIWKDGIFITYDNNGKIDKYIIVSLDCYDLIVYRDNERLDFINLNDAGQNKLFKLIK